MLISLDAELGWIAEYTSHPPNGLLCPNSGIDRLCGREQCSRVYGFRNGHVSKVHHFVALLLFSFRSSSRNVLAHSKPIRRPALKQVLRKFATIPEESEPGSLTRRNTSDNLGDESADGHISTEKFPKVNGVPE